MGLCNATRLLLMAISTGVLIVALGLTVVATIFPAWHTVHVTSKPERIVHHGLWMHCVYSHPSERRQATDTDSMELRQEDMEKVCDLNKDIKRVGVTMQAKWLPWKRTVLMLMCAAFAMGLITLLVSFCGYCHKWFTVAWSAGSFVTLACALAAIIVYFVNGHTIEGYRTYSVSTYNTYLQQLGWAYWCACAAVAAYLINAIITVPIAIMSFRHSAGKHQSPVLIPWNHNHHTAV